MFGKLELKLKIKLRKNQLTVKEDMMWEPS